MEFKYLFYEINAKLFPWIYCLTIAVEKPRTTDSINHFRRERVCMCMCLCVCVCVYVCVCIFFRRKGFSWLSKTTNVMSEFRSAMVFSAITTFVVTSKTIIAGTFKLATVQKCQLNQAKPQEIKDNSYILSKKPTVKARNIATFLFANLGSCPNSAHGQILSNCYYTEKSAFNWRRLF